LKGKDEERVWRRSRFLRLIREKIDNYVVDDDDDDNDDYDDDFDGAFLFPRRRFVFDSRYPKNIQDSLHPISVTSMVFTQKFVSTT